MSSNPVKISIKVSPDAGRNEVAGQLDTAWRIKIAAPPDKGRANKELIDFLSKTLGVKRNSLSILRGHASRNKLISVEGLTQEEVNSRLSRHLKPES